MQRSYPVPGFGTNWLWLISVAVISGLSIGRETHKVGKASPRDPSDFFLADFGAGFGYDVPAESSAWLKCRKGLECKYRFWI